MWSQRPHSVCGGRTTGVVSPYPGSLRSYPDPYYCHGPAAIGSGDSRPQSAASTSDARSRRILDPHISCSEEGTAEALSETRVALRGEGKGSVERSPHQPSPWPLEPAIQSDESPGM